MKKSVILNLIDEQSEIRPGGNNMSLRINFFDIDSWDNNHWISSNAVQEHFNLTFRECLSKFEMSRIAEWNKYPFQGQKITVYFRKKET